MNNVHGCIIMDDRALVVLVFFLHSNSLIDPFVVFCRVCLPGLSSALRDEWSNGENDGIRQTTNLFRAHRKVRECHKRPRLVSKLRIGYNGNSQGIDSTECKVDSMTESFEDCVQSWLENNLARLR